MRHSGLCHRRRGQGGDPWPFQATRGLQHHQCWCQGLQPGDQLPDPGPVTGDCPAVVGGPDSYVQLGLGYINADVKRFRFHARLLLHRSGPSLHDAVWGGPGNGAGSRDGGGAATRASLRSAATKGRAVCRTPIRPPDVVGAAKPKIQGESERLLANAASKREGSPVAGRGPG